MSGNPSADPIAFLPASKLAPMIARRQISAVEVMRATLARAERLQPILNCFITICAEQALAAAQATDIAIARGETLGPLAGVPFSVKDLVNTKGVRTTFGSFIHEHNVPAEDQVCIARLKEIGRAHV